MIDIRKDNGPQSKCYFSHSLLPAYIDPQNVSTKKKPFSTFNEVKFAHTLDIVLPQEVSDLVRTRIESTPLHYARVYLRLLDLLIDPFFSTYIKNGNICMLSEGCPLVDNIFSLYEGTLRLELDRPTYERCGLQGTAMEDGGKKHQKARWVIEYDMRDRSMVHGKKGFGRLEWACRNVLNQSVTWLWYNFMDVDGEALREGREVLSAHAPFVKEAQPELLELGQVSMPDLRVRDLPALYEQDDAEGLLEYLDLLRLDAPRVKTGDRIDPYLSRYEVPAFERSLVGRTMVCWRWRGFIPSPFVRDLFLAVRQDGLKVEKVEQDGEGGTRISEEKRWFALSASGFGGEKSYTVMQWAGRETLCWAIER